MILCYIYKRIIWEGLQCMFYTIFLLFLLRTWFVAVSTYLPTHYLPLRLAKPPHSSTSLISWWRRSRRRNQRSSLHWSRRIVCGWLYSCRLAAEVVMMSRWYRNVVFHLKRAWYAVSFCLRSPRQGEHSPICTLAVLPPSVPPLTACAERREKRSSREDDANLFL